MTINNQKHLHICVVTQQFGNVISGIGLHSRNLISHLVADGFQVTVLAPQDQVPSGPLPFRFFSVPNPAFSQNQARWLPLSLSFARKLEILQQHEKFDLIHFTDAREALFCRLNAALIGNVNDTYAADLKPLRYYRKYYKDWYSRWCYYHFVHLCESIGLPHLNAILANSHYTAKVIQKKYGLLPQRLHIIHKSIEPDQYFATYQLRAQIPHHPPRVLFVGGNMQRKGLPTLIQAAALVLKILPETKFWIVGRDKAEKAMKNLCQKTGVEKSFYFFGLKSQSELLMIYAQADIFALPSLTESYGVVFLEAMAAGLPVIGTCVGGIPEIIDDGQNGLLVKPDDPKALSQAIINILQDEKLSVRLQRAGLETSRLFNVDAMMEETYGVYQKILSD